MILIDENKLTYGTLSMIGQDYKIPGLNPFELEEYVDRTIDVLKEEEREYYNTNNYSLEIENIIDTLIEDGKKEEVINLLKDLLAYISRGMELKNEMKNEEIKVYGDYY